MYDTHNIVPVQVININSPKSQDSTKFVYIVGIIYFLNVKHFFKHCQESFELFISGFEQRRYDTFTCGYANVQSYLAWSTWSKFKTSNWLPSIPWPGGSYMCLTGSGSWGEEDPGTGSSRFKDLWCTRLHNSSCTCVNI